MLVTLLLQRLKTKIAFDFYCYPITKLITLCRLSFIFRLICTNHQEILLYLIQLLTILINYSLTIGRITYILPY